MPIGHMQAPSSPGHSEESTINASVSQRSPYYAHGSQHQAAANARASQLSRQLWLQSSYRHQQHTHQHRYHPCSDHLRQQQHLSTMSPGYGMCDRLPIAQLAATPVAPIGAQLQMHTVGQATLCDPTVSDRYPAAATSAPSLKHQSFGAPRASAVPNSVPCVTVDANPMGLLERLTRWQQLQQQWRQQQHEESQPSSATCGTDSFPLQLPSGQHEQQVRASLPDTRTAAAEAFIRQQSPSTLAHMAFTISSRALHTAMLALCKTSTGTSVSPSTSATAVAMSAVQPTAVDQATSAARHVRSAGGSMSAQLHATSARHLSAEQQELYLMEAETALVAAARRLGMARTFAAEAIRTNARPASQCSTLSGTTTRLQSQQHQRHHRLPVKPSGQQLDQLYTERRQRAKQRLKEILREHTKFRLALRAHQQQQEGQAARAAARTAVATAAEDGEEVSSMLRPADM